MLLNKIVKFIKDIPYFKFKKNKRKVIVPREEHCVSRKNIPEHVLKVLYRIQNRGFDAYLVGGAVRDLLLGEKPKDFDIVTNAHPEQVKRLFQNSRIIGKRFRLVHVFFGKHIVEVATFRSAANPQSNESGMIIRDNQYGTIAEDVWRRDFTINAIYYNIKDFSIVDYTGGLEDLKTKTIRIIGVPSSRFKEDPVRILRAIRFAAKLNFSIPDNLKSQINKYNHLLKDVSKSRILEDFFKFFYTGHATKSWEVLDKTNVLKVFSPAMYNLMNMYKTGTATKLLLNKLFSMMDHNYRKKFRAMNYSLFMATMLYPLLIEKAGHIKKININELPKFLSEISGELGCILLTKNIHYELIDIYISSTKIMSRNVKSCKKLIKNNKLQLGIDLLNIIEYSKAFNVTSSLNWAKKLIKGSTEEITDTAKEEN